MQVLERIEKVCREVFGLPELMIDRDTTSDDIEEWDSFAHMLLISALANEFDIEFEPGETAGLLNIGELENLIEEKL